MSQSFIYKQKETLKKKESKCLLESKTIFCCISLNVIVCNQQIRCEILIPNWFTLKNINILWEFCKFLLNFEVVDVTVLRRPYTVCIIANRNEVDLHVIKYKQSEEN